MMNISAYIENYSRNFFTMTNAQDTYFFAGNSENYLHTMLHKWKTTPYRKCATDYMCDNSLYVSEEEDAGALYIYTLTR